MTELLLIRHGQTDWNLEGRYTGQTDVPLNAKGISQAKTLARRLANEPLEAIYTSDLSRARQTAELLAQATMAPLVVDRRLREIDQGQWEGLLFDEIRSRFHEAWKRRVNHPLEVAPPGGETVGDIRRRVLEALEEILHAHPLDTVAIVAHGLALAIIKVHLNQQAIQTVWDHIPDNVEPERLLVEVS